MHRVHDITPGPTPPADRPLRIVIIGLTITSSWGNGHATTYRGLVRELAARGHDVLFLEHDKPWYLANRDLPNPPYGRTELYADLDDLSARFGILVREADVTIVGSYVPQGVEVGQWVIDTANGLTAFYDIDTPVTLAKLGRGDLEYLSPDLIRQYDLYLSFTGGPTLRRLEQTFGSPCARALYCSVDPTLYFQEQRPLRWSLGYLGTYSIDRQPTLETLLIEPSRRWPEGSFVVAGPQYPPDIEWGRVERIEHLPPAVHRRFYNEQAFTLNVTRSDMIAAGYSPSVRLFEAAACGVPIISDWWDGLDTLLTPDDEILIARTPDDVLRYLRDLSVDHRRAIGQRAMAKVLGAHTAAHRAAELEGHVSDALRRATSSGSRS
ncbi:MAG TPA: glycosyltransferase [Tepidisphaeraceae bacterium]|jgi:spore maturation protein CgeB